MFVLIVLVTGEETEISEILVHVCIQKVKEIEDTLKNQWFNYITNMINIQCQTIIVNYGI